MIGRPAYYFKDENTEGIDKVPVGTLLIVKDFGNHIRYFIKISETGLSTNTTIEQAYKAFNLKEVDELDLSNYHKKVMVFENETREYNDNANFEEINISEGGTLVINSVDPQAMGRSEIELQMVGEIVTLPFNNLKNKKVLICDGRAVSKNKYPDLYEFLGDYYGEDETTFNLPDYRGLFQRGLDLGKGIDPNRVDASLQGHAMQDHSHECLYTVAYRYWNDGGDWGSVSSNNLDFTYANDIIGSPTGHWPEQPVNISSETRPVNIAVVYCIRY